MCCICYFVVDVIKCLADDNLVHEVACFPLGESGTGRAKNGVHESQGLPLDDPPPPGRAGLSKIPQHSKTVPPAVVPVFKHTSLSWAQQWGNGVTKGYRGSQGENSPRISHEQSFGIISCHRWEWKSLGNTLLENNLVLRKLCIYAKTVSQHRGFPRTLQLALSVTDIVTIMVHSLSYMATLSMMN